MSKRQSMMPPASKPPTSFAPSIVIGDHTSIAGTKLITIGSDTVIHPRSKLSTLYAPITIGSTCIISERSQVGIQTEPEEEEEEESPVVIEDGVVIEVGAIVEASRVGKGTLVEINAKVGKGAVLGKHCRIGPLCVVAEDEVLPDFTVIYGNGMRRIDSSGVQDLKLAMVARQVEVLKKLIPNNVAKFQ